VDAEAATPASPEGEPVDPADELERLRMRVAAQDRLVAALLEENEDIHALRRRNAELEQRFADFTSMPPVRLALGVRNRLRALAGRRSGEDGPG
jgi:hypothetical protein